MQTAVPIARLADPALSSFHPSAAPPPNGIPTATAPEESTEQLLETTIAFAYAVARTDGSIARKEFQRREGRDVIAP